MTVHSSKVPIMGIEFITDATQSHTHVLEQEGRTWILSPKDWDADNDDTLPVIFGSSIEEVKPEVQTFLSEGIVLIK